ncbi:MAG: pilus assembly protein [Anaerolineae bacterium]|nr:pilus assembly protein [Anaerolineae bacterium]
MRYIARNREDQEKGQSLVESAMMFTVLLVVVTGVVDLGRGFFLMAALREAVAEGATYASVHPGEYANSRYFALTSSTKPINLMEFYNAGSLQVDVKVQNNKWCAGVDASGNPYGIYVEMIYTMPLINPFFGVFSISEVDLKASTVQTILSPICG